jgi:hypothetical protein
MFYRLSLKISFVLHYYGFRISFFGGGRFGNYLVFDGIKIGFMLLSLCA